MSVSSTSEPPFNEFYDRRSISSSEENVTAKERQVNKNTPATAGRYRTDRQQNFLESIFVPFQSCCFSRRASRVPAHNDSVLATQLLLEAAPLSESESGGTSSDDKTHVAVVTEPQILAHRSTKKPKKKATSITLPTQKLRSALESKGLQWADLASTQKLDSAAKWTVSAGLQDILESSWLQLTQENQELIALGWCRRLELSERMNAALLKQIIFAANKSVSSQQSTSKKASITVALEKIDEFSILEFVRLVEARLVEEVMGEFRLEAESTVGTGATYLIISNIRTVAICCRDQGDVKLMNVFDLGISRDRGPAFLGFDNVDNVETYLLQLYLSDPLVSESTQKFSAWTIRSKHEILQLPEDRRRSSQIHQSSTGAVIQPVWEEDDTHADISAAYSAFYKATEEPDEKERLFTQTAKGAINVD